jgi:hypothetical protein
LWPSVWPRGISRVFPRHVAAHQPKGCGPGGFRPSNSSAYKRGDGSHRLPPHSTLAISDAPYALCLQSSYAAARRRSSAPRRTFAGLASPRLRSAASQARRLLPPQARTASRGTVPPLAADVLFSGELVPCDRGDCAALLRLVHPNLDLFLSYCSSCSSLVR